MSMSLPCPEGRSSRSEMSFRAVLDAHGVIYVLDVRHDEC